MTVFVAVPDATMLERLTPAGEDVALEVWTTDDSPLDRSIDLLVLPYSVSAEALPRLAASRVSVVQSQALGNTSATPL
jgi:hypothetical protein